MAAVPDLVGVDPVKHPIEDLDVEAPLLLRGHKDQVIQLDDPGAGSDRL
jgi:hypothetical protein